VNTTTPNTPTHQVAAHRAHVIADDDEALAAVQRIAPRLARESAERDAQRRLPFAELAALSASGLLGITVPREHGGAQVRTATLVEVFRQLAVADPNIAQIPQSHVVYLEVLRVQGTSAQQELFFTEALAGRRFGNAQSEAHTKHVQDYRTRLTSTSDGGFVLNGVKRYSTGALFAHWIGVLGHDDHNQLQVAYIPADTSGVTIIDDWDGMGQRTTANGTVRLDAVPVPAEYIVPHHLTFTGPQIHRATAQVLHAAIDAGIAAAALGEGVEFVRTRTRSWFEAGVTAGAESTADDPLLIQRAGELAVRLRSAEAVLAADTQHPAISDVVEAVEAAHGLIVASPVYKAAYTGLLKAFLDLLPQYALARKTVLPLVTGGTPAHLLAVDYALRPVLASMGAHVGQGYFLLDQLIGAGPGGDTRLAPEAERPLLSILDAFSESLAFRPVTVTV
jgi:SsuE family FMN reductase